MSYHAEAAVGCCSRRHAALADNSGIEGLQGGVICLCGQPVPASAVELGQCNPVAGDVAELAHYC